MVNENINERDVEMSFDSSLENQRHLQLQDSSSSSLLDS